MLPAVTCGYLRLPAITCEALKARVPAIISTNGRTSATPTLQWVAKVLKNHILSAVSALNPIQPQ
jgi:hypothetical protein